jgi:hypothetical protein
MPSPIENKFSVFNEVMVSLFLYALLDLTDFLGDNHHREETGYVLVAIIFLSVAANFIKFLVLVIIELRLLFLKRYYKAKKDPLDADGSQQPPAKFVIPVKSNQMNLPGVYMHG